MTEQPQALFGIQNCQMNIFLMKLCICPLLAIIMGKPQPDYLNKPSSHFNATALTNIKQTDTIKKPTVTIEKILLDPMIALMICDSTDLSVIGKVFERDYEEIFTFIHDNGLRPGKFMAFYLDFNNPISLEVAVEVDKIPGKLPGRIKSKMIDGGDAIVAHYKGPYEKIGLSYHSISQWLKDNHKQAKGLPFECYLNVPAYVNDKYELKTDIYQLLK
jgi:effector-binding domain-containing protein